MLDGDAVAVEDGVEVRVLVLVGVGVALRVAVRVDVFDGVGLGDGVRVAVAVLVVVGVGAVPPRTSRAMPDIDAGGMRTASSTKALHATSPDVLTIRANPCATGGRTRMRLSSNAAVPVVPIVTVAAGLTPSTAPLPAATSLSSVPSAPNTSTPMSIGFEASDVQRNAISTLPRLTAPARTAA